MVVSEFVLVLARWMLARIWSASLVQVNGRGWSFQLSMKAPMAAVSSLTEVKVPRRMAWRVMMRKKHSTRFSQEQLVGTKCRVIAGRPGERSADYRRARGQRSRRTPRAGPGRAGGGGLLQEAEGPAGGGGEQGVGDRAGGDLQGGEQGGGSVPDVVMGLPFGDAGRIGRTGRVRSRAWIWVSSTQTTTAFSGGARYRPTTSRTLASSCGSVENLNPSVGAAAGRTSATGPRSSHG